MAQISGYSTGIDFSDRSIQIVQLEYKKNKLKSVLAQEVKLPFGVVEMGEIKNPQEFDTYLNKLLDEAERGGFLFENVTLSIPEEYLKVISVEVEGDIDEEHVDEIIFEKIKHELLQYSESWKYEIFEIQVGLKKKYLFLGVETDKLLRFITNAAEFGLEVSIVEPDSFSLLRHVPVSGPQVVVDFGEHKTILYFMFDGLLHKRFILEYGANEIMSNITESDGLKREKEEILFQKVGYSIRATARQKEIVEKFFTKFNPDLQNFINEIQGDYDVHIDQVFLAGGLSGLKGVKNALSQEVSYKVLKPIIPSPQINTNFLNSSGAALSIVDKGLKVNFLTTDIKQDIEQRIDRLMEEKEEELLKKELERLSHKNRTGNTQLKETFNEKWGEKEGAKTSWKLSFKVTTVFQLLAVVLIGLVFVAVTLFIVNNQNLELLKEDELAQEKVENREYYNSNFELSILGGEIQEINNTATLIGRFEEYIFEMDKEFEVTSEDSVITEEMVGSARKEMEELAKSGLGFANFITLEDGEVIIPEAVKYTEAQAGADKEIGVTADSFVYSLRAVVKFAIIDEDRFEQILNQRKLLSLRSEEQNISEDYEIIGKRFHLNMFKEEDLEAKFTVFFEARK